MTRIDLVEYCRAQTITLEAWAPLVRGERFDHPVVVELAKKYNKSPAQVLIRYGLDRVSTLFPSPWFPRGNGGGHALPSYSWHSR